MLDGGAGSQAWTGFTPFFHHWDPNRRQALKRKVAADQGLPHLYGGIHILFSRHKFRVKGLGFKV